MDIQKQNRNPNSRPRPVSIDPTWEGTARWLFEKNLLNEDGAHYFYKSEISQPWRERTIE